eukprot:2356116-Prorocentrum_lima.AAC.1
MQKASLNTAMEKQAKWRANKKRSHDSQESKCAGYQQSDSCCSRRWFNQHMVPTFTKDTPC